MKEIIEPSKRKLVVVRVTSNQHRKIRDAARGAKVSMSEYMRRAANMAMRLGANN